MELKKENQNPGPDGLKIIDCTGDACKGDYVYFSKAVFSGTYPNSHFEYNAEMEGLIIAESYGKKKQQHTFTIELNSGEKMTIKGRNLYRNGCKRNEWANENDRVTALIEKHERGIEARRVTQARRVADDSRNWF